MKPIRSFEITPSLPPRLERLRDLAYNLWWAWHMEGIDLFRRLDRGLWERTNHNPVLFLGTIEQDRLSKAAQDEAFLASMQRVLDEFDEYMCSQAIWYQKAHEASAKPVIAYFCAEFGLTDCIRSYSGGLGVLSGDHLKTASDLGLPLVGVGLLYQEGYFRQYLTGDGWQMEQYPQNDFSTMPLQLELTSSGAPRTISINYPGRVVEAQIWRVQVGRVPLLLLDTNIEQNSPDDRAITNRLYGGDRETRIQQEILLGIGGVRALKASGITPVVCHMNEGHSAFLALERIRSTMEEHKLAFAEAREATVAGNAFTTHTSVPAGIDLFSPYLMDKYFSDYYGSLGLTRDQFLALGRINSSNTGSSADEPFNMAVLALHLSAYANGVSKLHRGVSRRMWQPVWPGVPVDEIPISSITNGVHLPSWVSHDMADLFDRYLGPDWRQDSPEGSLWSRADDIPEEELWRTHERRRERLVAFARRRLRSQLEERGAAPSDVEKAREVLDPEALTIGFARRFASYKRSTLIFRNMERLAAILNDKQRPVQIIMAGKAHPMDSPAKELIKTIIQIAGNPELRHRIVFLENYDMAIARYMLQGVDIWLNTPLRFMEASGTSGMKAAANGAVNLSVLDGWWDEAYQPEVGWAIGRGEVYDDRNYQDDVESNALYDLLEKEIIPSFYDRGSDGLPRRWSARMKAMMRVICPYFNTNRMVREYTEQCYVPLMQRYVHLSANGHARAKALARWKAAAHDSWPLVRVMDVKTRAPDEIRVGTDIEARAVVHVGGLGAKDISVELYHGLLDAQGEIKDPQVTPMTHVESRGDGDHVFRGTISVCCSGKYGYTIRVMPHQEDLGSPYQPGLITWA